MSARVVVTDYTFPDLAREQAAAQKGGASFEAFQCKTEQEVASAVAGASVVAVQFAPFGAAAARAVAPGATVIRYGVGYDNIDLEAARDAGLKLGYVPDYCADEVADHTAAAALALLRKLPVLDASVRAGKWAAVPTAKPLAAFEETVIGFFGLGRIGRAVHARLRGFGFRFIAADPKLEESDARKLGIELVSLSQLLARADVISLHAPATAETTGFFNAVHIAQMKPNAFLVNSARGQLVDEDALAEALKKGVIAGAALDVFVQEPLPDNSPLRSAPGLLLTPHAAWYSDAAIGRLQGLVAEDIARALRGDAPRQPVNIPG